MLSFIMVRTDSYVIILSMQIIWETLISSFISLEKHENACLLLSFNVYIYIYITSTGDKLTDLGGVLQMW